MSVHRREVHAETAWQITGPELVDLRQEPCARDCGDGPVRGADAGVQAALWLHHRSTRSSGAGLDCRDEKPDGRLDCAPAHRGFSVGFSTGLSDPRSGPRLRSSRLPTDARNGHPGQTYCTSFALAERIAERLIGSIRRECLDHVIIGGEVHLRRVLETYARYYNEVRTHRSLGKDAPLTRPVQHLGRATSSPVLGGLHHHYVRI